jgi:predicted neuraminidase
MLKELIDVMCGGHMLLKYVFSTFLNSGLLAFWLALFAAPPASAGPPDASHSPIATVTAEFIFEQVPFAQSHASTLAAADDGLVAAWFGGTRERNPDVGIWLARRTSKGWSTPREVANGLQEDGNRYPCWNPVLFRPQGGPLLLFYKVGPDPSRWWGMVKVSTDDGHTWREPVRLPEGILGPVKNKPIQLADGTLLSPSSTEHGSWQVQLERSSDLGRSWTRGGALPGAAGAQSSGQGGGELV